MKKLELLESQTKEVYDVLKKAYTRLSEIVSNEELTDMQKCEQSQPSVSECLQAIDVIEDLSLQAEVLQIFLDLTAEIYAPYNIYLQFGDFRFEGNLLVLFQDDLLSFLLTASEYYHVSPEDVPEEVKNALVVAVCKHPKCAEVVQKFGDVIRDKFGIGKD